MEGNDSHRQPAVHVYALGRFIVEVGAAPLDVRGRTHRRPWQLLKVLIALAAESVSETQLVEALWPELDGDRAHRAFITNLYRLRLLIGREAVRLEQGRLTLDRDRCWVDALAVAECLHRALRHAGADEPGPALAWAQKALNLYKGPFLAGEFEFPELLSARERLHSHLLRAVQAVGRSLCEARKAEAAIGLYRVALEVDDQSEELYQGLMRCLLQQGRATEGLATYERCRRMLEAVAGAQPAPESEALRRRLSSVRPHSAAVEPEADERLPVPGPGGPEPLSVGPGGERRQATVLVCTVPDYGRLMEASDPEQAAEVMDRTQGWVNRCVESRGGVVTQVVRNQVVALFGVPAAHEDDPRRAVQAALEACGHLGGTSAPPSPDGSSAPTLAAGIASGLVLAEGGDERSGRYKVTGAPLSAAARLADRARAGQVLVTRAMAPQLGPFFELKSDVAQGVDQAEVLRVVRELPFATRFEAATHRRLTRFAGRASELALLEARLEEAGSGSGQVVMIKGEAGVGKSRLVFEFARRAAERGVPLLQGRCQAAGVATPYLPFRGALRQLFSVPEDATSEEAAERVILHVQDSAPALAPWLPHYLHLLSLPPQGHTLPARLTGEALRQALQQALEAVLLDGAPAPPVALLLEDWHWADEASEAALRHLLERVSARPLLVVITWRPEQKDFAHSSRSGLVLDLGPLTARHGETMIRWALGATALPEGLAAAIQERTGGNPFFIEETATLLLELGAVVVREGRAELTVSLGRLPLPATVQAVIRSRLDRLEPGQRRVVSMAAVIGREFPVELLGGLMSGQDGLERILDSLVSQGLVHPVGPVSQPRYRFKHALTQLVAYDALPRAQREALHEQVGSLLEARHADRLEPFYEGLAYHFANSANLDKALHYLERAGAKSAGYFALKDARQHYHTAVGLLAGRELPARDRQRRIAFTLHWADVSFYAATPELLRALQVAGEDAVAAGDEDAANRVHFARGQMFYVWARFAEALREFRICEAAARSGQPELHARSRLYIGRCCYFTAEFAAGRRHLQQSMAARLAQADPADAGYGGLMLASIHGWRGRFAAAEAAFDEALARAARLDDPSLKSATLNMRSIVRALRGEFAAALADATSAAELAGRIDNVYIAAYARIASGYARFMQGERDRGLGLMEEGVTAATRGGGHGLPVLIAWHAEALAVFGRLEEAQQRLDYAEQSALLSGQRVARPILLRTRALLARAGKRKRQARSAALIEESIEEARRSGARPDAAIGQYRLAELLCSWGDATGIAQAREAARAFGALGMAWWRKEAIRLGSRAPR